MNYKSLNSAIRSVTNPQPKLVKEDIQTPQRKAEGEKDIKNLSRTRTRRLKSWTKHPNPGSSGYYDAEDRFDKANSAKAARQDQQSSERSSSDTYGKGGKIVKKGKVQKPIEKKGDYVYSHYRDATITKAQALKDSKSKIFNKMGTVKEEQEYIELLEFALEAIAEELECDVEDLLEDLPPKSYVDRIKKKTAQLSPEQRAAAMKDRNSSIHRTPAELKKFAASRKAYVKSQNNRTDSKGKKLDAYDDYQS